VSEQPVNVKNLIREEYFKCANDPVYFLRKYVYIQNPTKGRILFHLYPFQEKVLNLFDKHQYSIILKSRQLGISTLIAGYALWLILFHKDKNILALATTQSTAKNLITKIRFAYDNLPAWLKIKAVENNKLSIRLSNGSQAKAVSSNTDSARSEAVSLLIIDEAAFIENIDQTFASAQQTLATGGRCIALSTPNGVGNWFHQTWVKAEEKENSFIPIKLPWTLHPERDSKWRTQQDSDLGTRLAAQECDCDFLSSGDTVFEPELINDYEQNTVIDPIERRGLDAGLWIWEYVDYNKEYMVVADVSRGDSMDYSAFHIFDIETLTQVAEYRGKLPPKDFANLLLGIATEYNRALLVVENVNVGWATLEELVSKNYSNLFYSSRSDQLDISSYFNKMQRGESVPGFSTTSKTRPLVIAKGGEFFRAKAISIRSRRLIEELRVFVWKNGKPQAQVGYNDDLVITFCIAMYVRDTAIRLRDQGLDHVRAQLNTITNLNNRDNIYNRDLQLASQYQMITPQGQIEDLNWLL
jgi:hypothetical protein